MDASREVCSDGYEETSTMRKYTRLQRGVARAIATNLDLFVDVKEAWLAVDAHGAARRGSYDRQGRTRSVGGLCRPETSISLNTCGREKE
jgi:hypothetical protein